MTTLVWDTVTGDGVVTGGAGSWASSSLWWTADGGATNITFIAGSAVEFGRVGGVVTLSGTVNPTDIVFSGTGYTLTGGTIAVGAGGLMLSGSVYGRSATIGSTLTGSGTVTIGASGTMTLTQSAGLALDVLASGGVELTGGWAGLVTNAGTLTSVVSLTQGLTNSGSAHISGTSGDITNTGGGTLDVLGAGLALAPGGNLINSALLGIPGTAIITVDGALSGAGTVTNAGASVSAIAQINVAAGASLTATTISNQAWAYLVASGSIIGAVSNAVGGSLSIYGTGSVTGSIANAGGLTSYGVITGDLTNSGSSTFALGATISGSVQSTGAMSVYYGGLSIDGGLSVTAGSLTVQAALDVTGAMALTGGTVSLDGAALTSDTALIIGTTLGDSAETYSLTAPLITFAPGAALLGDATLGGDTLMFGPGNDTLTLAAATIAVTGAPVLTMNVTATGQDQIIATGAVDLGMADLALSVTPGLPAGSSVPLIAAAGGLSLDLTGSTVSGPLAGWLLAINSGNSTLDLMQFDQPGTLDLATGDSGALVTLGTGGAATVLGGGLSLTQISLAGGVTSVTGTAQDDTFDASAATQGVTLDGGGGDDVLTGGSGADTFVFADMFGSDVIDGFTLGSDLLDLSAYGDSQGSIRVFGPEGGGAVIHCIPPGGSTPDSSLSLIIRQGGSDAVITLTHVDANGTISGGMITLLDVNATLLTTDLTPW